MTQYRLYFPFDDGRAYIKAYTVRGNGFTITFDKEDAAIWDDYKKIKEAHRKLIKLAVPKLEIE